MSATFAATPPPPPSAMLALPPPHEPLAATGSLNLLDDSFQAYFLRPPARLPRPLSAAPLSALSPHIYTLSPRLPSALPPSASPRIVEPVTPDRHPLPYEDAVTLCERAPLGTVDDRAAAMLFDTAPRLTHSRSAPPIHFGSSSPVRPPDHKAAAMSLQLPMELAPLRASAPPAHTAPLPWHLNPTTVLSPFAACSKPAASSPFAPWTRDLDFSALPSAAPSHPNLLTTKPNTTNHNNQTNLTPAPKPITVNTLSSSSVTANSVPPRDRLPVPELSLPTFTPSLTTTVSKQPAPPPANRKRPRLLLDPCVASAASNPSPPKKPVVICKRSFPNTMPAAAASATTNASSIVDPLRCHMCGHCFARRSNLFKHLRSVHDDRRRFECKLCPYKFKRQDHLLKHMRSVHAKVRKFACDICGFGFAEKFNRDKHRRSIHMTKRAFQCECGAYFQDREKMQKCLRCKSTAVPHSNASF